MDALHDLSFVRIEFQRLTYADLSRLWAISLDCNTPYGADVNLEALANTFRFSGGQIWDAIATARNMADLRNSENRHVTMNDLYTACRLHSNRKLAELAQKITLHYTCDDIILPDDRLQQLREICNYLKYRSFVYDQWGFDRKLSWVKGSMFFLPVPLVQARP